MEAIANSFDLPVFLWVQNYIWGPFLDFLMPVITSLGNGGIFWIILTVVMLCFKKTRKCGVMMAFGLIISLVVNDFVLKPLISRPRPFNFFDASSGYIYPELVSRPTSWSFPSGHTSSSFAAAVPLFSQNKKLGIPALILAALIGFSRIYVHVHYCSDVLAGVVVGALYGIAAIFIGAAVWKVLEPKLTKKKKAE
ncbi:MAG: phosphatase PAP2 family protein [Clostridiales bacterium]|nr:phosphatase PAP2 family protein [Clostridiales bacterium]